MKKSSPVSETSNTQNKLYIFPKVEDKDINYKNGNSLELSFISNCINYLLSDEVTQDGLISKLEFSSFINEFCRQQQLCDSDNDDTPFSDLPISVQLAFVEPICTSELKCIADSDEKILGFRYNKISPECTEMQIKDVCSSIYPLLEDFTQSKLPNTHQVSISTPAKSPNKVKPNSIDRYQDSISPFAIIVIFIGTIGFGFILLFCIKREIKSKSSFQEDEECIEFATSSKLLDLETGASSSRDHQTLGFTNTSEQAINNDDCHVTRLGNIELNPSMPSVKAEPMIKNITNPVILNNFKKKEVRSVKICCPIADLGTSNIGKTAERRIRWNTWFIEFFRNKCRMMTPREGNERSREKSSSDVNPSDGAEDDVYPFKKYTLLKDLDNINSEKYSTTKVLNDLDAAINKSNWDSIYNIVKSISKSSDSLSRRNQRKVTYSRPMCRSVVISVPVLDSSQSESEEASFEDSDLQSSSNESDTLHATIAEHCLKGYMPASQSDIPNSEVDSVSSSDIFDILSRRVPLGDNSTINRFLVCRKVVNKSELKKRIKDPSKTYQGDDDDSCKVIGKHGPTKRKTLDPKYKIQDESKKKISKELEEPCTKGCIKDNILFNSVFNPTELSRLKLCNRSQNNHFPAMKSSVSDAYSVRASNLSVSKFSDLSLKKTWLIDLIRRQNSILFNSEKMPSFPADTTAKEIQIFIDEKDWLSLSEFGLQKKGSLLG